MATEITETERKYDAPPGAPLPDLADLPGVAAESDPEEQTLKAQYYDTDDLRLIRHGITLRHRTGGSDAGWHLKLPLGGDSRGEIRLPPGPAAQQVPAELAALVRAFTRGAQLRPVAQISTVRQRRVLLDDAGDSLAEVVADDVSAQGMGDAATLSRWQEAEVELTRGGPDLLEAADKRLRSAGLRPAGRQTKLERALADVLSPAARPPSVGGPSAGHARSANGRPGLAPRTPAADVIMAYARAQVATLMSFDPLVRRDAPDAVHQMRVATRRLRSMLSSFAPVLRRDEIEAGRGGGRGLGGELKWLGDVLGSARDAEVLDAHLQGSLEQMPPELVMGPVQARVRIHFAPVEAGARAAVLEALDSDRYLTLLDSLDRLLADPPLTLEARRPAAEVLPPAVRRARRRLRRRMRRARSTPTGPDRDAALHEARKAAKHARYSAEAVSPAFGKPALRFAKRVKKVQSALGDHHDGVVARGATRELGVEAHLAGENAFTFGVLYEQDACRASDLEEQARHALAQASRPKYSSWLRQ
ncbi:MAG TPA: CYTH and CHAD domain-containing protein [Streptosporangiaceae bacterium]|nr:CYTH and CHAD domain-containing protein [Streptosporangiaceae bacterium]